VTTFLVEAYATAAELAGTAARVRAAAEEAAGAGLAVRYLRSILVPGDQTSFHLVEGASADAVAELGRRASLPFLRIVEASCYPNTAQAEIPASVSSPFGTPSSSP